MKKPSEILVASMFAAVAWAITEAVFSLALFFAHLTVAALSIHALAVPLTYALAALVYFRREKPLAPLLAAAWFGAMFLLFEAALGRSFDPREAILASVLPACAAVVVTWLIGVINGEQKGVSA